MTLESKTNPQMPFQSRNCREYFFNNRKGPLALNACPGCHDGRRLCPPRTSLQCQQNKLARQTDAILHPRRPKAPIAIGIGSYSIKQLVDGSVRPKTCDNLCCC
jgi:hypothetical protein